MAQIYPSVLHDRLFLILMRGQRGGGGTNFKLGLVFRLLFFGVGGIVLESSSTFCKYMVQSVSWYKKCKNFSVKINSEKKYTSNWKTYCPNFLSGSNLIQFWLKFSGLVFIISIWKIFKMCFGVFLVISYQYYEYGHWNSIR